MDESNVNDAGCKVTELYLAEERPICRLIVDEKPPLATKIWLITKYGTGYAGTYDKQDKTIVAWCPLPKLTAAQKHRLKDIIK